MQAEARREPFTGVDHAWLRMESAVNPMVITAVIVLEGLVEPGRIEALIEERLLPHARFRQRPVGGVLLGTPRWELDPRFDLRNHVVREKLPPPGGRVWLEARIGELFGRMMDHRRPLWEIRIVEGYEGGTTLICRFHHCMADGMALLQVLLSLTDDGPGAPPKRPAAVHPARDFDPRELLDPEKLLRFAKKGAAGAASLARLLFLPPDARTPLRGRLSGRKATAWTRPIPLADLKAIGRRNHATVNDVLQCTIAGAFGRYLESRGISPRGLDLRAVVTVDLRPPGRPPDNGNYFGLVFLDLPVGIADPADRLHETKRRMDRIKSSPEAAAVYQLLHVVGFASARIEELVLKLFGSKASVILTNVPGPKEPRLLAGKEIKDIMFWVPESGGIGIGISFFAYRGNVRVGVVTDTGLVPDPGRITAAFEAQLAELGGVDDDIVRTAW